MVVRILDRSAERIGLVVARGTSQTTAYENNGPLVEFGPAVEVADKLDEQVVKVAAEGGCCFVGPNQRLLLLLLLSLLSWS